MRNRISTHIRGNVVGYVAVFLALSGTAAALPGRDTVFGDDIVAGEVRSVDIGPAQVRASDIDLDAVTSGKIVNRGVRSVDLASDAVRSGQILDGQVQGIDVLDDGLTGADLDESSLSEVPEANDSDLLQGLSPSQLTSFGGSDFSASNCEIGATIGACASVTLSLPLVSDVLVIAAGEWFNGVNARQDRIHCSLRRDGVSLPGSPSIDRIHGPVTEESVTLTGVAQRVPAGVHRFELACSELNGEVGMRDRMLSAVVLR